MLTETIEYQGWIIKKYESDASRPRYDAWLGDILVFAGYNLALLKKKIRNENAHTQTHL